MRTFLKNDGWKAAARFITYEFEQLVCLLFTPGGWRSHLTVSKFNLVFVIERERIDPTSIPTKVLMPSKHYNVTSLPEFGSTLY